MRYTTTVGGRSFQIEVEHDRLVWVDGCPLYVDLEQVGGLPVYNLVLDDTGYVLFVEKEQEGYRVEVQGQVHPVEVVLQRPQLPAQRLERLCGDGRCLTVRAPLAGRLITLPVAIGDPVQVGQVVAVIESMKMKLEIKVPEAGVVEEVHGPPERDVAQGEELVTLRVGQ